MINSPSTRLKTTSSAKSTTTCVCILPWCAAPTVALLSRTAYVGKNLFAQLNNQAQFALPRPKYMKVDDARKIVRLSEIFQWYKSDFSSSGKTGAMYMNQFRKNGHIRTWYTLECYPCNLDLEQPEVERCRNRGQQISPRRA